MHQRLASVLEAQSSIFLQLIWEMVLFLPTWVSTSAQNEGPSSAMLVTQWMLAYRPCLDWKVNWPSAMGKLYHSLFFPSLHHNVPFLFPAASQPPLPGHTLLLPMGVNRPKKNMGTKTLLWHLVKQCGHSWFFLASFASEPLLCEENPQPWVFRRGSQCLIYVILCGPDSE